MTVIVCGPDLSNMRKRVRRCPVCECRTEFVDVHEYYHGVTMHCCRCGDSWQDGELMYRPFAPGWRAKSVAAARRLWDRATHGPNPTFDEWRQDAAAWREDA